jgi:prevent-host-death family protein
MDPMSLFGADNVKTMPAKEAKQSFGALLDAAQREPVTITKNGREVAVLVSKEDFERLEALEDAHWGALAMKAHEEGHLSEEETRQLFQSILNAKD